MKFLVEMSVKDIHRDYLKLKGMNPLTMSWWMENGLLVKVQSIGMI